MRSAWSCPCPEASDRNSVLPPPISKVSRSLPVSGSTLIMPFAERIASVSSERILHSIPVSAAILSSTAWEFLARLTTPVAPQAILPALNSLKMDMYSFRAEMFLCCASSVITPASLKISSEPCYPSFHSNRDQFGPMLLRNQHPRGMRSDINAGETVFRNGSAQPCPFLDLTLALQPAIIFSLLSCICRIAWNSTANPAIRKRSHKFPLL